MALGSGLGSSPSGNFCCNEGSGEDCGEDREGLRSKDGDGGGRGMKKLCIRQRDSCQSVHEPRYHFSGLPSFWTGGGPSPSHSLRKKLWNGAVKTAATSLGSSRGISFSSTERPLASEEADTWVGRKKATQGRTPSSVLARFAGSSQRCSTVKPRSLSSFIGRPISSSASRRATSHGDSSSVSALPELCQ